MNHTDLLQRSLTAIDTLTARLEAVEGRANEPIAVVGLACRFPGGIASPRDYWRLLREGRSGIIEIPRDRWDVDDWYDPDPASVGTMSTRYGGFLDRVDAFDAGFFRISPREAATLDPQQRLLLECAWEALEDAGVAPDGLTNSPTGAFVGITSSDYARLLRIGEEDSDVYSATGTALNAAAGRISFVLGLQGPSMAVDTACSSSLVATHLACQSLRNRECDHALVGGVNVMLSPEPFVLFSKWGMLANSGECRTFDAGASGFVRGEGCGVLVLRRLSDARAAGDRIVAIIRGSAVNQDGPSSGLSVPNGPAQVKAIRAALQRAGVSPADVGFVEAHGTGTPLGDPIEIEALGEVYREGRSREEPLLVGSVKPSIGHLESAAGVAGLIKLVLAVQHGELPPQRNYERANPRIDWEDLPIRVVDALQPWPNYRPRRIGAVSSFGFSGTNVHMVVEAAPEVAAVSTGSIRVPGRNPKGSADAETAEGQYLLPISARSPDALRAAARSLAEVLAPESPETTVRETAAPATAGPPIIASATAARATGTSDLRDIERTLMTGRAELPNRAVITGTTASDLAAGLRALAAGESPAGVITGAIELRTQPQIAFLYSGQGSQYHRMGLQLRETFPVYREAFDRCAKLLVENDGPDLIAILTGEDDSAVHQTAVTQPALFAVEYALTELFASWGIHPNAVFGHSIGEYVAACVAGVFPLDDALRLIAARGRLMQALPAGGGMLAVAAEAEIALEVARPFADRVSLAALNGPTDVVLSGALEALAEVARMLTERRIKHKPLTVSHAFHSPLMEPVRGEFEAILRSVEFHPPTLPLASNLTGMVDPATGSTADYWSRHIRQPVAFEPAMRAVAERCTVLLELGPRPVLLGMARRFLDAEKLAWVASLRGRTRESTDMLEGLAGLWTAGVQCDWEQYLNGAGRRIALPTYPFQRKRYWAARTPTRRQVAPVADASGSSTDAHTGTSPRQAAMAGNAHPLLGPRIASPLPAVQFDCQLDPVLHPMLADHQVAGAVVFPAAGYIELARAAGQEVLGGPARLEAGWFRKALILDDANPRDVRLVCTPASDGSTTFELFSRPQAAAPADAWISHAGGVLAPDSKGADDSIPEPAAECTEPVDIARYRERMAEAGLEYGPTFQALVAARRTDGVAIGELSVEDPAAEHYGVHPGLLDAAFHLIGLALPDGLTQQKLAGNETAASGPGAKHHFFLPVGFKSASIRQRLGSSGRAHCVIRHADAATVLADIAVLDESGAEAVSIEGIEARAVSSEQFRRLVGATPVSPLLKLQWQPAPPVPAPREPAAHTSGAVTSWLVLAESDQIAARVIAAIRGLGAHGELVTNTDPAAVAKRLTELQANGAGLSGVLDLRPLALEDLLPHARAHAGKGSADVGMDCTDVATNSAGRAPGSAHTDPGTHAADELAESPVGEALGLLRQVAGGRVLTDLRMVFVTRGARQVNRDDRVNPAATALWGIVATAAAELSWCDVRLLDLDPAAPHTAALDDANVRMLAEFACGAGVEDRCAVRNGARYVERLVPADALAVHGPDERARSQLQLQPAPYTLVVREKGDLTGLALQPGRRGAPGPRQVEIEVLASGLNFRDVLNVLDLYPGEPGPLGNECCGRVTAVGRGVRDVRPGDLVTCIAEETFGSHVIAEADLTFVVPPELSIAQAATFAIAWLTAYLALYRIGRIRPGQRVLIHAAAGGVGLAAVRLAHAAGAEVLATAGSEDKRALLRGLGVRHVFDSRTPLAAHTVLEATDGHGVDLLLNSLTGAAIDEGLHALAPGGHFLEIGLREVRSLSQVAVLREDIAYTPLLLGDWCRKAAPTVRAMWNDLLDLLRTGRIAPLPVRSFPLAEVDAAFRYMARGRHIGRVAVMHPAAITPVRGDGVYVVTGGLGALGLHVADWLAARGAKHVVLVGRSAPGEAARRRIAELETRGVRIDVLPADVTRASDLQCLKGYEIPIRGLVHAAGIVDDAALPDQDDARLRRVLKPKLDGALTLLDAVDPAGLDFLVFFSSGSALLGSPGQAAYAGANACLDGLAHRLRAEGRNAISINWGAWEGSGMAAALNERTARTWRERGIGRLTVHAALTALDQSLNRGHAQLAVLSMDWGRFFHGLDRVPPLLSALAPRRRWSSVRRPGKAAGGVGIVAPGHAGTASISKPSLAPNSIEEQVLATVAAVVGLRRDEIDPHTDIGSLGFDSLMAIEAKNRFESGLGIVIPSVRLLQGGKVRELIDELVREVTAGTPPRGEKTEEAVSAPVPVDLRPSAVDPRNQEFPLSHPQRALWFLYQSPTASAAYNVAFPARVRSRLDVEALAGAFRALVERHPLLRTTYHLRDGEPVQRLHATLPVDFELADLPGAPIEIIRDRARADVRAEYDLENGPILRVRLYRRAPDDHVLVFGAPHIAVDGWSVWLMLDELRRLYPAALTGESAALPPLQYRYVDYVRWQQELLDAPAGHNLREYWDSVLARGIDRLELPTDRDRPPVFRFAGDMRSFTLGPELTAAARKFARQEGVTLYTLFLAIYQTLLHRYTGQEHFLVGSPTTGRTRPEFAPVVGCFVNGVTIRAEFAGTPSFRSLLRNVHTTVLGAIAHQDYPLSLVNRNLRSRDASRSTGFQADFVFQKPQQQGDVARLLEGEREGAPVEFAGLQVEGFQVAQQAGQLDLTLELLEGPDQITGDFKYHTDLFEAATIDRLIRHFLTLVEGVVTDPDCTVDRLPLLPANERAAILEHGCGGEVEVPALTVVDRLERVAGFGPERSAVVVPGQVRRALSYGTLMAGVDRVCTALDAAGAGDRIAYCFVPSERSVVTVFGIWKSGRTAIPLDPAQPRERVEQILVEAAPSVVVAEHAIRNLLPSGAPVLWWEDLDAIAGSVQNDPGSVQNDPGTGLANWNPDPVFRRVSPQSAAHHGPQPEDPAYVIFTSGSTGRPKGVVISHASLLNALVGWEIDYELGPNDVHLQMAAPAFDVWMGDLVRALGTGGTLVVCPREWLLAPERLAAAIADQGVTVAEFVPAVFRELRDHLNAGSQRLESLRLVACGSDQWYQVEIASFREVLPACCRLVNSYGVTEATIDSSWFELESVDAENRDRQVPIGWPFANVRLYVVDRNLEPVPYGVVGELCIGGPGVALGYLDRPELDVERFLPDPHNPGARLYRTGDLARLRADGKLELVGRADTQVKIRGNRVELGEIEARLCEYTGVRGAVAVFERGAADSGGRLGAFIVPAEGARLDPAAVRSFVRDKLPAWMVPGTIRIIERIPLNASGKVDRKALPQIGSDGDTGIDRTPATTETEARLLELWREVLDATDFGIHADFFQLGGHSLLGTRMVWLVGERFGVELPFHVIFEAATVAELARRIDAAVLSDPVPAGSVTETFEF